MSTYANAAAHQTGRATRSANLPLHPPMPDARRVRREPVQQDGTLAISPVPDGNPAALDMIDASASRNESVGGTADPTDRFGNQDPDPGLDTSSDLESSFSTSTVVLGRDESNDSSFNHNLPGGWNTVPTRRRSFDNLASEKRNYLTLEQEFKLANQNRFSSLPVQKIKGKDHVIEQAKGNMTTKERELLERRELAIQQKTRPGIEIHEPTFQRESTAGARGEGPSQHKGKGPDPANWNLAGLNDEERDIEYQRAAYQSLMEQRAYSNTFARDAPPHFDREPELSKKERKRLEKAAKEERKLEKQRRKEQERLAKEEAERLESLRRIEEEARKAEEKAKRAQEKARKALKAVEEARSRNGSASSQKGSTSERQVTPAAVHPALSPARQRSAQPIDQLGPSSLLAIMRSQEEQDPSDSSDSDDSSSSSGGSSSSGSSGSSSSSSDSSSSSESEDDKKKRKKKKSKKRSRRRSRSPPQLAKVQDPKPWDGKVNLDNYLRFRGEVRDWARDGKVRKKSQVSMVSKFLEGRAWNVYLQEVAHNPRAWKLSDFMDLLFNRCFPSDYLTTLRERINEFKQGNLPVREFARQLENMCNMVGIAKGATRVHHLWSGLDAVHQRELWLKGLNPEVASWDDVLEEAENSERAQRVVARQERRSQNRGPRRAIRRNYS